MITRQGLPAGIKCANILHAAGESADPKPVPGCRAVCLEVENETELRALGEKLTAAGIRWHGIEECDDDEDYPGQMMAIGIHPTQDRSPIRKVTSAIPLVK